VLFRKSVAAFPQALCEPWARPCLGRCHHA